MLQKAAAYCSIAERCVQDVEKKILAAGFSDEVTERILARLKQEKFIDEIRFCRGFVNDKLRFNKWGRIKIGYELKRRQIAPELIREALNNIDDREYQNILSGLLKEKKKNVRARNSYELFQKLLRFAAGRGFETSDAITCLKQLNIHDDTYEENME